MYINEIPADKEVVLSCYAGSKWVKFSLKTDKLQGPKAIKSIGDAVKGRFVVTEPARTQGKVVNFPQEYKYDLSLAAEGRLSTWSNVRVYSLQIDKPKKRILIIVSNEQSKRTDRRRSYRLGLNIKGEAKFSDSAQPEEVIIKDISETGAGIIVSDRNSKANIGDNISISFTEIKGNQTFSMRIKIVRTENAGGGKTIYGGTIIGDRVKKEIAKYIGKTRKIVAQK